MKISYEALERFTIPPEIESRKSLEQMGRSILKSASDLSPDVKFPTPAETVRTIAAYESERPLEEVDYVMSRFLQSGFLIAFIDFPFLSRSTQSGRVSRIYGQIKNRFIEPQFAPPQTVYLVTEKGQKLADYLDRINPYYQEEKPFPG